MNKDENKDKPINKKEEEEEDDEEEETAVDNTGAAANEVTLTPLE